MIATDRHPGGAPRTHESCALGQRIEGLAAARGMTLVDVASSAGLSLSSMHDIRRGVCRPRLDTLDKIAEAVGVDASRLLAGR